MPNWFRRLFRRPRPSPFNYVVLDSGFWRCDACVPNRVVHKDNLSAHAQAAHGWKPGKAVVAPPTEYRRIPLDHRTNEPHA